MFLKSLQPQLQEGAIVYRKELQPLKIIFGLTCNFTINELLQYDFVFKALERLKILFFFHLGILSQPFTNHRTAGEEGGHFFNSSLPLPPTLQTLRHQPDDYCRELTYAHSSSWTRAGRKSLTNKVRALKIKLKILEG